MIHLRGLSLWHKLTDKNSLILISVISASWITTLQPAKRKKDEALSSMDDVFENQQCDITFSDDWFENNDDDNYYSNEFVFIDEKCNCLKENETSDPQVICNKDLFNRNLNEHIIEDDISNTIDFHDMPIEESEHITKNNAIDFNEILDEEKKILLKCQKMIRAD